MKLLTAKDLNLLRRIFLMGEMSKFLAVGSPGLPINVQGKGKKGDGRYMNLGNNPAAHGFVLRNLILIELFQISHDCVTECMLQAKFL